MRTSRTNGFRALFPGLVMILAAASLVALSGCGGIKPDPPKEEAPRETIFGTGGIFGSGDGKGRGDEGGAIGVNTFLWRATLDTIAFMPVASADPFGGVIITDWYNPPETPGERFKLNAYILGRALRADGIRVSVFKEAIDRDGIWRNQAVDESVATDMENAILLRARQLRNETINQ